MIQVLERIKSYLDYGIPTPIQIGAIEALRGPQACVAEHAASYEARRDTLIDGLARPGAGHWLIEKLKATMFVWARTPAPHRDMGSVEFAMLLLRGANVAVSPGVGFGKTGEENQHRIRQAVRNIRRVLERAGDATRDRRSRSPMSHYPNA